MKRKENLLMTSKIHAPRLKLALLVSVLSTAAGLQAQGKWTSTNSLNFARSGQTANLLSTGMVLVAGGENTTGNVVQSELYNPSTGAWDLTGNLNSARTAASAVVLPSGNVLVAGGCVSDCSTATKSAEIYNPSTGK
jgi:N-acetylneuraminic acid mutarotase